MIIQLSDTLIRKGDARTYSCEFGFDDISWMREKHRLTDKKPAVLRIENTGNGHYQLHAEIDCNLHLPCDRCLKDVVCPIHITDEREPVTRPTEAETMEDGLDDAYIQGYELDVDEFIRSELFLHIPMKVLCKEDCKGLCPKCGADLNKGACGCLDGPLDPRMAAIQDIFRESKSEE